MMECYRDLEEKIWQPGLCASCGACAAVCPTGAIEFVDYTPSYQGGCKVADECVPCSACYFSCPRLESLETGLIGSFQGIYGAVAVKRAAYAQSGGAVTSLLVSALEEGLVDGVLLLSVDRASLKPRPVIATRVEEVVQAAGSRYGWANVLEGLDEAVKSGLRRLAIVGTPCVIQSVHRIRNSNLDVLALYRESIRLTIGVFCSGIFYRIEDALKLHPWEVRKLDIHGKNALVYHYGGVKEVPLKDLEGLPGCLPCLDFSAELADISAGNMGTPEGHTTLIVRSDTGVWLTARAVENGSLKLTREVETGVIAKAAARKKRKDSFDTLEAGGVLDYLLEERG